MGLAGVQIDQLQRIIIVRKSTEPNSKPEFLPLINPKIVRTWGPMETAYEGCLSVPNYYTRVERYHRVRFRALNILGRPVSFTVDGFLARIIQHEVDHLKGIMTVDRAQDHDHDFGVLTAEGKIDPVDFSVIQKSRLLP